MKLTQIRFCVSLLTSAWVAGIGLRFILMGTQNIYELNTLDLFFDWGILFTLGISLLLLTIYFYVIEKEPLGEKNEQL